MHLLLSLVAWHEEYERYCGTILELEENPYFAMKGEYYDEEINTKAKEIWSQTDENPKLSLFNKKEEKFIDEKIYGVDELLLFWIFLNMVDTKFITLKKNKMNFNWDEDPFFNKKIKNVC